MLHVSGDNLVKYYDAKRPSALYGVFYGKDLIYLGPSGDIK